VITDKHLHHIPASFCAQDATRVIALVLVIANLADMYVQGA